MVKPPAPDQWMTRTIQNVLDGPFTKDEVCQKVLQGQLKLQDEVCQANDYWFFLHEAEEVKRFLGVEVPRQKRRDDDDTQTETETQTATQTSGGTRTDPAGARAFPMSPPPAMRESFHPEPVDSTPTKEQEVAVDGGEPITKVVTSLVSQGPTPSAPASSTLSGKGSDKPSAPYGSSEEEERTEVQSLNIGREIAARIDSSVSSSASSSNQSQLNQSKSKTSSSGTGSKTPALSTPSSNEVETATDDIAAAGKNGRMVQIIAVVVVLAILIAGYYFLIVARAP